MSPRPKFANAAALRGTPPGAKPIAIWACICACAKEGIICAPFLGRPRFLGPIPRSIPKFPPRAGGRPNFGGASNDAAVAAAMKLDLFLNFFNLTGSTRPGVDLEIPPPFLGILIRAGGTRECADAMGGGGGSFVDDIISSSLSISSKS